MAIVKTNVNDIVDKNYAEFDLGLICEEAYSSLKPLDMVLYTLLNNQHGLSVKTTLNGSKRFVDSNGYIFVSIGQEKLCKMLRTTIPTLKASLKRLANVDLIQEVNVGNMKCNRIYVGKLNRTITLGDYMKNFNISTDEEDAEITIRTTTVKDIEDMKKAPTEPPVEARRTCNTDTSKKQNNYTDNIPQNDKTYNKNSYRNNCKNKGVKLNPKIHKGLSTKFLEYGTEEELEISLKEVQGNKFNDSYRELYNICLNDVSGNKWSELSYISKVKVLDYAKENELLIPSKWEIDRE